MKIKYIFRDVKYFLKDLIFLRDVFVSAELLQSGGLMLTRFQEMQTRISDASVNVSRLDCKSMMLDNAHDSLEEAQPSYEE